MSFTMGGTRYESASNGSHMLHRQNNLGNKRRRPYISNQAPRTFFLARPRGTQDRGKSEKVHNRKTSAINSERARSLWLAPVTVARSERCRARLKHLSHFLQISMSVVLR